MDVVVANIPPRFKMLLSCSWATKVVGTLQIDMYYASIHIFGETRRVYREVQMKFVVSSKEKLENNPIYVVDTDLGSTILYNDLNLEEENQHKVQDQVQTDNVQVTNINDTWSMHFDGFVCKEGLRDGIYIITPDGGSQVYL